MHRNGKHWKGQVCGQQPGRWAKGSWKHLDPPLARAEETTGNPKVLPGRPLGKAALPVQPGHSGTCGPGGAASDSAHAPPTMLALTQTCVPGPGASLTDLLWGLAEALCPTDSHWSLLPPPHPCEVKEALGAGLSLLLIWPSPLRVTGKGVKLASGLQCGPCPKHPLTPGSSPRGPEAGEG